MCSTTSTVWRSPSSRIWAWAPAINGPMTSLGRMLPATRRAPLPIRRSWAPPFRSPSTRPRGHRRYRFMGLAGIAATPAGCHGGPHRRLQPQPVGGIALQLRRRAGRDGRPGAAAGRHRRQNVPGVLRLEQGRPDRAERSHRARRGVHSPARNTPASMSTGTRHVRHGLLQPGPVGTARPGWWRRNWCGMGCGRARSRYMLMATPNSKCRPVPTRGSRRTGGSISSFIEGAGRPTLKDGRLTAGATVSACGRIGLLITLQITFMQFGPEFSH